MTAVNLDSVVNAYNAIRDARTVRRHAWEKADAELEKDQNALRAFLLDILNKSGAQSVRTQGGTVYRTERIKPSAADWGAIWAWAVENDAPDIFERRLKSGFIKEFMDEHEGAAPPGVNVHREFEVAVRRASSDKEKDSSNEPT